MLCYFIYSLASTWSFMYYLENELGTVIRQCGVALREEMSPGRNTNRVVCCQLAERCGSL